MKPPRDETVILLGVQGNSFVAPEARAVKATYRIVGTLLAGCSAIAGASVGLYEWLQAKLFQTSDFTTGYEVSNFVGLVAFLALTTLGFTLLYTSLRMLATVRPSGLTRLLLVLLAMACVAVGVAGAVVLGGDTMKCFGIFCVNPKEHPPVKGEPTTGNGWRATVGFFALFSLVPVGCVILGRMLVEERASQKQSLGSTSLAEGNPFTTAHVAVTAFAIALLIFVFGLTGYMPDSFPPFYPLGISVTASWIATANETLCGDNFFAYTCPELGWAWFTTTNVRLSENVNLKFFPGNVFFYAYLILALLCAAVVRSNRRGRLFVKKQLLLGFSVGEVALTALTLTMLGLFFAYWAHDHNFNNNWTGGKSSGVTLPEVSARVTGQLGVALLSLLFFPASRNSVIHCILGTSWETALWAHRVLGYGVLACVIAHMVSWYRYYDVNGVFPLNVFHVPLVTPIDSDNFTILLSTLAGWTLLVAMGVFALFPLRRKFFELFYYLHLFAAYITIPAIMWHAASGWEYMLPGVTVWFVDRMIRLCRSGRAVELESATVFGDIVTELKFTCRTMSASPGQYVFLCVPEISLFEWHPFSLSTACGAGGSDTNTFSVHIRSMGPGTWTARLLQLAKAGGPISLAVDGPCGRPVHIEDYRRVVLVAGGIGVTPCASIYSFLKGRHDVSGSLLWCVRENDLAHAFVRHFARNSVKGVGESNVKIFFTQGSGHASYGAAALSTSDGPVLSEEVQAHSGRPNLRDEIASAVGDADPDTVLVFACGPEELAANARTIAMELQTHFHKETFFL